MRGRRVRGKKEEKVQRNGGEGSVSEGRTEN